MAVFLACVVFFVLRYLDYRSFTDDIGSAASQSNTDVPEQKPPRVVEVPVNFEELKAVNSDIYAWINIPGTKVDYPILQSGGEDGKSYYLKHNVNRKSSAYGAIYTQDYNSTDFNDFNTVIYGHNMKNGTMFGSLRKFRDRSFFDQNNIINVYLPGRALQYKIFGAYVFDDRHIMLSFDFTNELDRELYLETVFADRQLSSNFNKEIPVSTDDKIITLSTCNSRDKQRFLVQGVLIYDSATDY